jgi:hypothetical protein
MSKVDWGTSLLAEFRKVLRLEDASAALPAALPRVGVHAGLAVGQLQNAFRTLSKGFGQPRQTKVVVDPGGSSGALGVAQTAVKSLTGGGASVLGFGLGSLVGGLFSLFGGSGKAKPAPLVRFALPSQVQVEAGISQGLRDRIVPVDSSSGGQPRQVGGIVGTPQVSTLNDQWFLDRSDQIANAVRQALLNGHGLSDVVNEL